MLGPLIAFALGVLASLALGGSLRSFGEVRFRLLPLFALSLVVPAVAAFGPLGEEFRSYGVTLIVASNILLIAFAVANRRIPGLALVAAGVFLNALVITVNGAMPVESSAANDVASTQAVGSIKHEPLTSATRLPWLADRLPVDLTNQVLSVGDLLLVIGVGAMGFGIPRGSPRAEIPRRRSSSGAAA